jgi:biopolymer transport protein ExbD
MAIKLDDSDDKSIMAEINMTPLIDIMLVLLIIFMVTSSVSLESGLDINLPTSKAETTKKESDAVVVSLDQQGNISIQGKNVPFEQEALQASITQALSESQTTVIVFEGDEKASIGKMVEIMDVAKKAGATQFAVATEFSN